MYKNIKTGEILKSLSDVVRVEHTSRYKLEQAIANMTSDWRKMFDEKPNTYIYDIDLSDDPRDSWFVSHFVNQRGTISRAWVSELKLVKFLSQFPEYERGVERETFKTDKRSYRKVRLISELPKRISKRNVFQVTDQWYVGETDWIDNIVLSILWRFNRILITYDFEPELYSPEYISHVSNLPVEAIYNTYDKLSLWDFKVAHMANEGLTELFTIDLGNQTLLEDFKGRTILDNGHVNPFFLMDNPDFEQTIQNRENYVNFYLEKSTDPDNVKERKALFFNNYINFVNQENMHQFSVDVSEPSKVGSFKGFIQYGENQVMSENTADKMIEISELIKRKNETTLEPFDFEQDTLTDSQYKAVKQLITKNVAILTGNAGSGKTYTTTRLVDLLGYTYKKHKPAKSDVVVVSIANRAGENFKYEAGKLHLNLETASVNKIHYQPDILRKAKLIIIEEASQLTVHQLHNLMMLNKTARYIFVGDVNQLPPIDGLSALQFLQDAGVETVTITSNVRQGEGSAILNDANLIKNGEIPTFDNSDSTLREIDDINIITRESADVYLALDNYRVKEINDYLHSLKLYNTNKYKVEVKGVTYCSGESVLITKGDEYAKQLGLVNGSILSVHVENGELVFKKSGKIYKQGDNIQIEKLEHQFAYAMTIFYAQGSTFDRVVTVVDNSSNMSNNALYTAITRASKKHTFFVKNKIIFENAIKNKISDQVFEPNKLVKKTIDPFSDLG